MKQIISTTLGSISAIILIKLLGTTNGILTFAAIHLAILQQKLNDPN